MEPHLQHTHGRHYDDDDNTLHAGAATHHTGHDYDEEEHHGEKKSVIKKVKEKAKKLKNTITKHGHGHGGDDHDHDHHHDEDDDDDDEEEMEEDPEVHGAPMYDSARVGLGGPDAILAQPRGNLERPSVMAEDRYDTHGAPPPVSTGPYGTNRFEPSGLGQPQAYGQEVNPNQWRGKVGQSTGMDDDHFTPMVSRSHEEGLKGSIGKSPGMLKDPNGPKDPSLAGSDPSNYETKVTDPTHTGGKEAELSQIQHSFGKMGIHDENYSESEPKRFDPNHPENLPRDGDPSSYVQKISSSASAIADKAADVIASKLGYSGQNPSNETVGKPGSTTDYAHKITDKVTETLAPVYDKVVDAGSSVISKVQGSVSGQPQVETATTVEERREADKGVSVKEYLVETLRPRDDDKALSEVITHAFHGGNYEESEKKSGEDRPAAVGRVTESEEVRRRLGSDRGRDSDSSNVVAERGVADRLKDAMGSWFGGKGDAPQGTVGTSYVTDEGLSTSPSPNQNRNGGSAGGGQ